MLLSPGGRTIHAAVTQHDTVTFLDSARGTVVSWLQWPLTSVRVESSGERLTGNETVRDGGGPRSGTPTISDA